MKQHKPGQVSIHRPATNRIRQDFEGDGKWIGVEWIRKHPGAILIIMFYVVVIAILAWWISVNPGQWPVDDTGGYQYVA